MPKFKVTYNGKPKRTQQIACQNFEELGNLIEKTFEISKAGIKYMKPRLKDEASFIKQVKDGVEILILGTVNTKEKSKQQIQKQQQLMKKARQIAQQKKISPQERILRNLEAKKIRERGMDYINPDTAQIQNLGADYICAPVHLLRIIPDFKEYCESYEVQPKNPDGLIIEQLKNIMHQTENKQGGLGIIDPVEWISAWITYCSDDIQFPYPTYDFDYFFNRLFGTMKSAYDISVERRDEESNQPQQQSSISKVDPITTIIGVQVNTKRTDLTKLDEDDDEGDKETDRKVYKYFLECDLSKDLKQTKDSKLLIEGIKQRFKKKKLWRNFYAFDIQYEEQIVDIDKLPKFLFVHCNRIGYPPGVEEWEYVQLLKNQKNMQKVKFGTVLDLYPLCNLQLQDKLQQGRYERGQLFYPFNTDQRYLDFVNKNSSVEKFKYLSEVQKNYMFFDSLLYDMDIYDQYYFGNLKGAKETGEYKLIGLIVHRGRYYHNREQDEKHDCIGQFATLIHKRGNKWLRFQRAEVDQCDIEDIISTEYWGGKDNDIDKAWTPVILLYREIKIKNMQLQQNKRPKKQANMS